MFAYVKKKQYLCSRYVEKRVGAQGRDARVV